MSYAISNRNRRETYIMRPRTTARITMIQMKGARGWSWTTRAESMASRIWLGICTWMTRATNDRTNDVPKMPLWASTMGRARRSHDLDRSGSMVARGRW